MFTVSFKDPLDAEKIGERRQRKNKEIQEGINSINEAVRLSSVSSAATPTPTSQTSGFSPVTSRRSSKSSLASGSIRCLESPQTISSVFPIPFRVKSRRSQSSRPAPASTEKRKNKKSFEIDTVGNPFGSRAKVEEFLYNDDSSSIASSTFSRVPSYISYPIPSQAPDPETIYSTYCRRLLQAVENSSDREIASRLAQRQPAEHKGKTVMTMHEFHFETALYSLVYTQRLSRRLLFGASESEQDMHLLPIDLHPMERSRLRSGNILHMGATRGSPESWYLGTKLPEATIHSLGLKSLPFDISSSCFNLPPNVLLEQWPDFPLLDYADGVLDAVIISHHLFQSIRCAVWPLVFQEISRILPPGGILMVSVMDVKPEQSGPLLDNWIHENIYTNVFKRFMVPCPSLLVPSWLEENGNFVEEEKRQKKKIKLNHRHAFPCLPGLESRLLERTPFLSCPKSKNKSRRPPRHSSYHWPRLSSLNLRHIDESGENRAIPPMPTAPPPAAPTAVTSTTPSLSSSIPPPETEEDILAASLSGWVHYQRLYADFIFQSPIRTLDELALELHENEKKQQQLADYCWWLNDKNIRDECEHTNPYFEMATFVYRRQLREETEDYNDRNGNDNGNGNGNTTNNLHRHDYTDDDEDDHDYDYGRALGHDHNYGGGGDGGGGRSGETNFSKL